MERTVGKAVVDKPAAHAGYHVLVVVYTGYQEVGYLNPHAGIEHTFERMQDRGKPHTADRTVDVVGERLEVYVGGVDIRQQTSQRTGVDIACRNQYVLQSALTARHGAVARVL